MSPIPTFPSNLNTCDGDELCQKTSKGMVN